MLQVQSMGTTLHLACKKIDRVHSEDISSFRIQITRTNHNR